MECIKELEMCETLVCIWELGGLCREVEGGKGRVQLGDLLVGDGIGWRVGGRIFSGRDVLLFLGVGPILYGSLEPIETKRHIGGCGVCSR